MSVDDINRHVFIIFCVNLLKCLFEMAFQGHDLVIGNVGDSRAVLATRDKDDTLLAIQLTVDLKPDLPSLSLSRVHTPALTDVNIFRLV